jgi:hypothetical protein
VRLQPLGVARVDPQPLALAAVRDRQVGADVEQLVLDLVQPRALLLGEVRQRERDAEVRGCVLGTRLMSPRCVSPPSPSLV